MNLYGEFPRRTASSFPCSAWEWGGIGWSFRPEGQPLGRIGPGNCRKRRLPRLAAKQAWSGAKPCWPVYGSQAE